ncbi:MAG: hypothetical protein ABIG93_02460 [archaeon]|nr:hypothetical protein [Nanoarchaeota archaeon]
MLEVSYNLGGITWTANLDSDLPIVTSIFREAYNKTNAFGNIGSFIRYTRSRKDVKAVFCSAVSCVDGEADEVNEFYRKREEQGLGSQNFVGVLMGWAGFVGGKERNLFYLRDGAVIPLAEGNGFMRAMVDFMSLWTAVEGYTHLVASRNDHVMASYLTEQCGFEKEDRWVLKEVPRLSVERVKELNEPFDLEKIVIPWDEE